jgi:predicted DNA-binding transcriptional regulator YafY
MSSPARADLHDFLREQLGEGPVEDRAAPAPAADLTPAAVARPGRPDAVSRLILLLRHLAAAGERGLTAPELVELGGYPDDKEKVAEASLLRDLKRLAAAGWQYERVSGEGEVARYVLHRRNLADQVGLAPAERSVLEALLAYRAEHVLPESGARDVPVVIRKLAQAVDHHCVVAMRYRDRHRQVEPIRLHTTPAAWWLRARDDDGHCKWFRLDRMHDVELDIPGSAAADIADDPLSSLNPHTWVEDPPTTTTLEVGREHLPMVLSTFPEADVEPGEADPAMVQVVVTNRAALFLWLVEMGTRVRLVGPDDVRGPILARLREVARG